MPESDAQRSDTARDLAYAQGKREAIVDGRLDALEAKVNAINGNIAKVADALTELSGKVATQDAVDGALESQRKQGVSNKQWIITSILMVLVVVLSVVLEKVL